MNKFILFIVGSIIGAIIVVATFPLWRPYFVDDVVDEAFPFPQMSEEERAAFEQLPADQQEELTRMADMALETSRSMATPNTEMVEDMPENTPMVLSVGSFTEIDAVHKAEGTATIYDSGNGEQVLRLENFRSTNGPELHVILTEQTEASTFGDVGDYVDLGRLKGNVGNQNYTIPADVNLEDYGTVVIYCVPFRVVFSTANLITQ